MTRFFLIVSALMLSVSGAQSIECRAELPAHRTAHWAYRMIDGRVCWYEGKNMISRSLLHWPASDLAPEQAADAEPVAVVASTPRTDADPVRFAGRNDHVASFETRWQGIFGTAAPGEWFDPTPAHQWRNR